jgi:enediyne biosynthesis protein E4
VDSKLIFGLGKNTKTDSVEVIWPDLRRQVLYNVEADKEIIIEQKNADKIFTAPSFYSNPLFTDRTAAWLRQPVVHKENSNVDFDTEKLIPYRLSSQGPTLAQADINGDGLEDIYVGGAAGEVRKILIQTASGFIIKTQDVFEKDKNREDAGAAFFDVDNDKDADLVVASGGYQFEQGSSLLEARLYINDGKGNFSGGDLPGIATNASCVRTADYDRDGYPDVFIGGRAIAGNYGKPGRSYLLHNEKGVLRDRTPEQLKEPGMVTDIVFSDTNLDGFPDIVMTGEWMPVNIFLNRNGIFEKKTVENSAGLWNCVTAADIDKDGDTDYILGNWGLNSRFRASVETPMELFINDFDNNGSVESLLAYYWPDGKSHLFNSRQDLMTSMPMLKNKFPLYKDFADKSVEDITGADALKKSTKLKVETLASSVLINGGNNQYALMPLPAMAQLSPVFTAIVADFDNDDNPDIFTGGNFFDSKPDIGRLDANPACLLKGDGKRHFSYVSKQKTGLAFDGQVRDGILIRSKQKKLVVLARNNASVLVLESGDD